MTLCRPSIDQRTSPIISPRRLTAKAEPSAARSSARHSAETSGSMAKRSTGVQQPMRSTLANSASSPLTTSRPAPGTVRTR
jgi:hypothetical protein